MYFRMALRKITDSRPETPYTHPPPLHVCVVAVKEEKKVLSWVFEERGEVRPLASKANKAAVLSDGKSVIKVTLFEAYASKVAPGHGYMMRGYSLRGDQPPYAINVTWGTLFFKSAPVEVSEELRSQGQRLLSPPSADVPLAQAEGNGALSPWWERLSRSVNQYQTNNIFHTVGYKKHAIYTSVLSLLLSCPTSRRCRWGRMQFPLEQLHWGR